MIGSNTGIAVTVQRRICFDVACSLLILLRLKFIAYYAIPIACVQDEAYQATQTKSRLLGDVF